KGYEFANAFSSFVPWFESSMRLISEIIKIYEDAEYNEKTCRVLVDRVDSVSTALRKLQRRKEEDETVFRGQAYYKTFVKLNRVLKNIKDFVKSVSQLKGFKKYLYATNTREKCNELIKELEATCSDLSLGIIISLEDQKKEQKSLEEDVQTMARFMETIDAGVTTIQDQGEEQRKVLNMVFEEVHAINKRLDRDDNDSLNFLKINSQDLKDVSTFDNPEVTRGKVFKRLLKGIHEVACKPVHIPPEDFPKMKARLAILSRLHHSDKIIKFHGLAEYNGSHLIIFDWAEHGNLKEVYERDHDMSWESKLSIAHDICRGLIFLHGCEVYHHDVRCENVLITGEYNYSAKLANFDLCRKTTQNSIEIKNIYDIVRWLAPEKMPKDNKTPPEKYTYKCEVFSYGMLLWELAFQKLPYLGMDGMTICEHVKSGKRERLDFPLSLRDSRDIIGVFRTTIKRAWDDDPTLRPNISTIFTELDKIKSIHSPSMRPTRHSSSSSNLSIPPNVSESVKQVDDDSDDDDGPVLGDEVPVLILPLEEGIDAHKRKERKKAWECFEIHAELGDPLAKFWKGYYLSEGYCTQKRPEEALALYKEAADANIPEAQLHYAFSMLDRKN
ncbi:1383_t:CDS:2, partial [Acaulospora morrowiae]